MINELRYIQNSGVELFCVALAYFIAVIFALTIHEFSHAFIAYKNGDNTAKAFGRMTLNPFKHINLLGFVMFAFFGFGWAKPVPINPNRFRHYNKGLFWVSVAGVIANIIMFILCSFIAYWFSKIQSLNYFYYFMFVLFSRSALLNLSFALFNILPIYPLDGFNAVAALTKYNNKYVRFMTQYGYIVLMVLLLTGLFSYVYNYVISGAFIGINSFWVYLFG